MTQFSIDLRTAMSARIDYACWPYKSEAVAALKQLRERGLNVEDCIDIQRAHTGFSYVWIIIRPDDLAEMTWLMREDGSWLRGRLYDGWKAATWHHQPPADGNPIPATFTHVTRTVPHARKERYKTKSNGSCGRWVMSDDSVALCTCGWKSYGSSRAEAQSSARWHRTTNSIAA